MRVAVLISTYHEPVEVLAPDDGISGEQGLLFKRLDAGPPLRRRGTP
jgi:hypothetical protein